MQLVRKLAKCVVLYVPFIFLAACGSDNSSPLPVTPTFVIGGSISGLAGSGLVLQNNAADNLSISADGSFSFPIEIEENSAFNVTVFNHPSTPTQFCSVSNGSGTVSNAAINNITVSCVQAYTLGGSVNGLAGSGLILQNNSGDDFLVTAGGNFEFSAPIIDGTSFSVSILSQPNQLNQICSIGNGDGFIAAANVSTVVIDCVTNSYTVGGSVAGLTGSGLVLQNNAGDNLTISSDGNFVFPNALLDGSDYAVTIFTQPIAINHTCALINNTGTLAGADISNTSIVCTTGYSVSVSVSGLLGSGLVLQNNNGDDLPVTNDGLVPFPTRLPTGSDYSVSVFSDPTNPNQNCVLSNSSGTIANSDISDVTIACTTVKYTISGTLTSLNGGDLVLQNNGTDNISLSANGDFIFATAINDGSGYDITVFSPPSVNNQVCEISNNSGILSGSNISDVAVVCSKNPAANWRWVNPTPQGNRITDITWAGSIYVAVGFGGTIITSVDGVIWTQQNSGTNDYLVAVAWSGDTLVAIGTNLILTSSNGIDWTSQVFSSSKTVSVVDVLWDGSRFVAYDWINSEMYFSTDGLTWPTTPQTTAVTAYTILKMHWNGSQYLMTGFSGAIWSSPDAITWTQHTTSVTDAITDITWTGSQYAVVNSNSILTSPDGVTWTLRNPAILGSFTGTGITWTGSQLVASGDKGKIITSPDGITWTARDSGVTELMIGAYWGNNQIIVYGEAGELTTSTASADVWTRRTKGTANTLTSVSSSGSEIVITGYSGTVLTSTDGINWTDRSAALGPNFYFDAVWTGNQYVLVGSGGTVRTSVNGIDWPMQTTGVLDGLRSISWNGSQLLAVGQNGVIISSSDAITWEEHTSNTPKLLTKVIWSGNQYVAVGSTGTLITSSDGINWIPGNSGTLQDIESISWNGKRYVAVGGLSTNVITSENGIDWTIRPSSSASTLYYDVIWSGSQFIAVGASGSVMTSFDGLSWINQDAITTNHLYHIQQIGSQYFAVGRRGNALRTQN